MNNQTTASAPSATGRWFQIWPWLAVLLVLLFVGFIRVRLLELPLERDEGEYAYAGQLILQGIPPYELAYNMKLPGTYFAYAAGMSVFGETTSGIHLTLLAVNSLTCIFVFLLGRKLFGVTAGLVACASYALLSVSSAVLGAAAHATQFVVLFAVPGTWLLWEALQTRRPRTLFFCGLLYGLAFVMKQQGICFGVFGFLLLLWRERGEPSGGSLKNILCYAAGAVLPFAVICLYLGCAGVLPQFWFWTFSYAHSYVSRMSWREGVQLLLTQLKAGLYVSTGFWLLVFVGLLLGWRDRIFRQRTVLIAIFWAFSFLGTATGLYFRQHYFILILPAYCILIGLGVETLRKNISARLQSPWSGIISPAFFALLLGGSVFSQRAHFFSLSPNNYSRAIYGENPFIESQLVASYIREHSSADARVAVIGSEPEIYFYARRHSATGYIYTYALMENQPYAARMQQEMAREIEAAKPAFIVLVAYKYSWLGRDDSSNDIFDWEAKYTREFYEADVTIGLQPDGQIVWLPGANLTNFNGPLKQFMVIYHRKPAAN